MEGRGFESPTYGPNELDPRFEGFVSRTKMQMDMKQLRLFHHPTTGDYWSTTSDATAFGYVLDSNIGFIAPPEDGQGVSAQIRNPPHGDLPFASLTSRLAANADSAP